MSRAIAIMLVTLGLGACTSKDDQLVAAAKRVGIEAERLDRMNRLIDDGANVNARDEWGHTVLMLALANLSADDGVATVESLTRRGADANATSPSGESALCVAAMKRGTPPEMIQLLIKAGASANAKGDSLGCPLRRALKFGSLDTMRALLSQGADANLDDGNGPLLLAAVEGGEADRVLLLLRHGAKADGWVFAGRTPLMAAISRRRPDLARLLLEAGADPGLGNSDGMTPLMEAAVYGPPDVVRLLLEKRVDVNARDRHGTSALGWALDDRIAEMLLRAGARVSENPAKQR